jgi:hypothetical protein
MCTTPRSKRQALLAALSADVAAHNAVDAAPTGAQSNTVNPILRLFLYHFLHTMSS